MWSPTHIQVTVHRARNLLAKGKNGRNNCYVTISVGKEKFMTTLQKDVDTSLEWHEQCELAIPEKGNSAELVLTCLHQNNFGLDDFLGQLTLPLSAMDVYEQPRPRWYPLRSKPGKEKQKDRGELEVRIGFTVKSGSLTDLNKKEKHKSSIGQLASNVGGSLLSINTLEKRKNLKKFAKSLGSKMHITGKKDKHKEKGDADSVSGSQTNVWPTPDMSQRRRQVAGEADPGVISEDDDEFAFDNLSHKSSGSSLNVRGFSGQQQHGTARMEKRSPAVSVRSAASSVADVGTVADSDYKNRSMTLPTPAKPPRAVEAPKDEWAEKLYGNADQQGSSDSLKRRSWEPATRVPLAIPREESGSDEASDPVKPSAMTFNSSSVTAPSSPAAAMSAKERVPVSRASLPATVPQPLPRSNTMESIAEKSKKAEKENKFTKKLKYLKREFGRSDVPSAQDDGLRLQKATLSGQFFHNQSERIIIGHENDLKLPSGELPKEVVQRYEGKSREEIITMAYQMENEVKYQKQKVKELEDYLDNLLLRVMETHPKILQNPYSKLNPTKSG